MTEQAENSFTTHAQIFQILAWIFFLGLLTNSGKGMTEILGPVDVQAVSLLELFNTVWKALLINLPTFLLAWAVYDLATFFGRCGNGDVFTRPNVKTLKLSASSLFWAAAISALIAPTILSWMDGDGRGFIWETNDLAYGVAAVGIALYGFASILSQAVTLKEENDEMI